MTMLSMVLVLVVGPFVVRGGCCVTVVFDIVMVTLSISVWLPLMHSHDDDDTTTIYCWYYMVVSIITVV